MKLNRDSADKQLRMSFSDETKAKCWSVPTAIVLLAIACSVLVAAPASAAPFRFFSSESFWNTPLAVDAPLDPNSIRLVGHFDAEIEHELGIERGPWISTTRYSVPIYTVGAAQPTVPVKLVSVTKAPALQAAFEQVPLPAGARPSGGTDGNLVVWQPGSDQLWEFWKLERTAKGPQASWGGAMRNVSDDPGVYGPGAWPGAQSWWGSACSLSTVGGLITLEDLQQGKIDHALAIAIPEVRAGIYASPARKTDGTSPSQLALPEGAHLRLDPHLDIANLHLPRTTRLIAEAAQRYGIFVGNIGSVVHFYAQDPVTITGKNPYAGPTGYFEGKYPRELLASFPWGHLELLKMPLRAES